MCSQWPNLGQLNIKIDDNNNILNSIAKIRLHSPHTLSCFSCAQLFLTLWTVAHKAPLSLKFSGQEYWSGQSSPSPGDLPNPGTEPQTPALQADSLLSEPQRKNMLTHNWHTSLIPFTHWAPTCHQPSHRLLPLTENSTLLSPQPCTRVLNS